MQYFFILGNNPTLSFAEIVSVLKLKPEQVLFLSEKAIIADVREELDVQKMIRRLGGTIKVGIVSQKSKVKSHKEILNLIDNSKINGKFNFGISYYGSGKLKNEKQLAMEIKKALKEKRISSRWVTSRDEQLSSVVVEQNKLITDKGVEIVIINDNGNFYIGKTLAVQPFKELSKRDYGRPGRDDRSGMLPPKLAQILINLSRGKTNENILDPFCGSGTVLTEAILMGYQKLIGYDSSEKAISDTKANIEWTKENWVGTGQCPVPVVKICDARELSKEIKPDFIDTIIAEPYLGPSRMSRDRSTIEKVVKELEQLYHEAILEFEKVLKQQGRIVMIWPVFRVDNDNIMLNTKNILKYSSFEIINPLKDFDYKVLKLTNRNTIIYGREGQKVWREIVILEK